MLCLAVFALASLRSFTAHAAVTIDTASIRAMLEAFANHVS